MNPQLASSDLLLSLGCLLLKLKSQLPALMTNKAEGVIGSSARFVELADALPKKMPLPA